ncbi:MAG: hypothetical protein IH989_07415 [Planctomycetes bacterium]|nr:hypothetical protein [Planctomycetota bacterium]
MTVFDADGRRVKDPEPTDRCSYFVNRTYYHRSAAGGDELVISHVEFVTSTGLVKYLGDLCGDDAKVDALFPMKHVAELARSR